MAQGSAQEQVRFGALIPTWYMGPPPKSQELVDYCRAAEGLGFDSLWVIDRLFGELPVLEPYTVMTLAAASTERVGIGSCVILAALRPPMWLAKEMATLDYLSGGRVKLGISLGGNQQSFDAVGFPLRQRTRRLEEAITIMRKLWTEDKVTWHGRYSQLEQRRLHPLRARRGRGARRRVSHVLAAHRHGNAGPPARAART